MVIRPIRKGEGEALLELVRALADSHDSLEHFTATAPDLEAALFCEGPIVGCLVAEYGGQIVGCAIWHRSFSTFRGKDVMYLEDLSMLPAFRRRGVARALLKGVAEAALTNGYPGIYWLVMEWNESARKLYEDIGAEIETGTCYCRIDGKALEKLAA